jgi:G3E family GTPase
VDANTVLPLMDVLPAISAQLEYSKQIIVNKVDLVSETQLLQIEEAIRKIAPDAAITAATYCRVDTAAMLAAMEQQADGPEGRETSNTYESRPVVFYLTCKEQVGREQLEAFLWDITPEAYRIKGFAPTDRGMIQVSVSGDQIVLDQAPARNLENRIAVITRTGMRAMSAITAAIESNGLKGSICV